MRILGIILFMLLLDQQVFSQERTKFFGQALQGIHDNKLVPSIEGEIRKNPKIKVVRIDALSGQVFIITNELIFWQEKEFIDLFGPNSGNLTCIFVGVYGKDAIKEFPFADCK
jgi:hypothetical protein